MKKKTIDILAKKLGIDIKNINTVSSDSNNNNISIVEQILDEQPYLSTIIKNYRDPIYMLEENKNMIRMKNEKMVQLFFPINEENKIVRDKYETGIYNSLSDKYKDKLKNTTIAKTIKDVMPNINIYYVSKNSLKISSIATIININGNELTVKNKYNKQDKTIHFIEYYIFIIKKKDTQSNNNSNRNHIEKILKEYERYMNNSKK